MSSVIKVKISPPSLSIEQCAKSVLRGVYVCQLNDNGPVFKYKDNHVESVIVYTTRYDLPQYSLLSDSIEFRKYIGEDSGRLTSIQNDRLMVSDKVNCIFSTTHGIYMMSSKGNISPIDRDMILGIR